MLSLTYIIAAALGLAYTFAFYRIGAMYSAFLASHSAVRTKADVRALAIQVRKAMIWRIIAGLSFFGQSMMVIGSIAIDSNMRIGIAIVYVCTGLAMMPAVAYAGRVQRRLKRVPSDDVYRDTTKDVLRVLATRDSPRAIDRLVAATNLDGSLSEPEVVGEISIANDSGPEAAGEISIASDFVSIQKQ